MAADDQPGESWLAGSWFRPAVLSVISVSAGIGTMHSHRDLGSVLAAMVCGMFAWHVWRVWYGVRATDRRRRKTD